MAEQKEQASGLHLNAKSIIGICILLVIIMGFAGVLTQTLPRGEYYAYPAETYRLTDGSLVALPADDTPIEADGQKFNRADYLALLAEKGIAITPTDAAAPEDAEAVGGMIIDGTYHEIDYKMPVWKILASPVLVFGSENITTGLAIILFIVLIGGTFLILDERGVLRYIMAVVIRKFETKKYLLLCIVVFICMLLSSTAGILEESVTLVPIACAISLALGWDSLVGLGISLVAVAFGFTAATFNPFNVLTVQRLAGLPAFSGLWLRLITFALVYGVLVGFLILYARKIEKHPEKSICYESDREMREKYKLENNLEVLENPAIRSATRAFVACVSGVLVCIVLDFALGLGGMLSMPGMALLFTIGGLLAGYRSGLRGKALLAGFWRGVKTIAPAIPLIFFILAITYILDEGHIVHTILHAVYNLIGGLSPYAAVLLLLLFIAVLEFFIGSGTAKAFLIMPIVAPLAQLIGISGNTVVLTFCMGDGFTNLLYPTSGIMIIAIGLVNVSYGKWLKFTWKLFVAEGVLSVALLFFAVWSHYA